MNNIYVFVYGTLRKNESNHFLLKEATLIARQVWTNGRLFDTGLGYPAMKESMNDIVYGELYLVSEEQLLRLDELEDYRPNDRNSLYNRKKQVVFYDTGKIEAYLYFIAKHNENMLRIPISSGDWKLYLYEQQKQTILYFAYGSCMDDVRFKLRNKNHFFQNVKGCGILSGFTLRFTRRAHDGGRADIVEEGGIVEGKVYEINSACLDYLYQREGVRAGCYRPTFVDINLNGKIVEDVLTFTVVNKEAETAPSSEYLEEILRGGTGCVSEAYLTSLRERMKSTFGIEL
ncbi:gamma-glutamylcyclotransferase [Neobacillus cucumis]|uniref:gamma-glutamylcyclotransferase n=1 Tax=Neobacillus cucumis TaxID=1740721 RepID=UPI002E220536|nr:gamma-glutamylcyclotransferase [Neobacillus cucumis]